LFLLSLTQALKEMFSALGFASPLTEDDIAMLSAAVGDGHGHVSFKDFVDKILPLTRSRKPTRDELARPPEEE
jgi:hypothetical protein